MPSSFIKFIIYQMPFPHNCFHNNFKTIWRQSSCNVTDPRMIEARCYDSQSW